MATQSSIPQPVRLPESSTEPEFGRMSVAEYLRTAFSPDCDYVDGEVQERNLGERDHSSIQKRFVIYFGTREKQWNIEVLPEQRVQVSATRFRIPDVAILLGEAGEQILTKPPFVCVEVLSPDDRMSRVRQRVDDYLAMGVSYIWVIDPAAKVSYEITKADGWREVKGTSLKTSNPEMEIPLSVIFV